jgi:hypothetical protein
MCFRDFTPESEALVDVGMRFSLCLLATSTAPFDAIAPYSAFLQRRIIGWEYPTIRYSLALLYNSPSTTKDWR